jgi:Branched-chain amino acid ABC-type transport system, permease components
MQGLQDLLPFIIIGLFTGAVYALAAAGLVLTYKTSGVFNFAHGSIGMFAAFIFFHLRYEWGWSTPAAIAVAVLVFGPFMGLLLDRVLLRWLEGGTAASYVVASLGLLVLLQGVAVLWKGAYVLRVDPFFSRSTYRLPGVNVTYEQTFVVLISIAVGLALIAFFRFTTLGLKTRAVVSDRELTALVGTNPPTVTVFSWMLGCSFAALSAILIVPALGLDSVLLTLLMLTAIGAVAAGRFTSLPKTMLAAFILGVVEKIAVKMVGTTVGLAAAPASIPFLVLFVLLVFSKKGSFVAVTQRVRSTPRSVVRAGRFPLPTLLALGAVAAAVPQFLDGFQLLTATTVLAFVLIFGSLSLLVGLSRQVSLCHAVFAGLGATTLAVLLRNDVPFLPALLLAGLVVVPVGALVALPAIRLSGLFLALATFGFGKLVQDVIYPTNWGFGISALAQVPRPQFLTGPKAMYYFILAVAAVGVVLIELIRTTRLGRTLRALADSPTAVESLGIRPTTSRLITFCVSAFLAGLGGGLLGSIVQVINPTGFEITNSLIFVTVLVAAGASTLGGYVLAAVLLAGLPALFSSTTVNELQPVVFGLAAMVLAQTPNGLVGLFTIVDWRAKAQQHAWRLDRRRSWERYVRARTDAQPQTRVAPDRSSRRALTHASTRRRPRRIRNRRRCCGA